MSRPVIDRMLASVNIILRAIWKWILLASIATLAVSVSVAEEAPPVAADPVLEKRVIQLSEELRCLVCQNQSLSDSNADLAVDLRNQVREMMQAGKTDADIREYMVARYGDFILYDPPLKATTLVLWAGPFLLLMIGGVVLATYVRKRKDLLVNTELTSNERDQVRALLNEERLNEELLNEDQGSVK